MNIEGNYREWSIQCNNATLYFRLRKVYINLISGYELEYRKSNKGWQGNVFPNILLSRTQYMKAIKEISFRFSENTL